MGNSVTPLAAKANLRLHGRLSFAQDGALGLSWSYSGFSFCFDGDGLSLTCRPYAGEQPTHLAVEIDGTVYKAAFSETDTDATFSCKNGPHTVTVRRASVQNGSPTVWISAVSLNGVFTEPPAEKAMRLEFIGDSITCGYGILGAPGAPYRTSEEDATINYAAQVARAFDAEARFLSVSGQGIVRNCAGEIGVRIPAFFHYLRRNSKTEDWQFDDGFMPDAVIINAGTNDVGGGVSEADFAEGAYQFILDVRAHYPQAKIVWFYGMMNSKMIAPLREATERARKIDEQVYFLPTTRIGAGEVGANGHPGILGHRRAAKELIAFLKTVL